ncbi:MAG TPA: hypothetical protein VGG98_10040 [Solirubrobacteraceae bacterium]
MKLKSLLADLMASKCRGGLGSRGASIAVSTGMFLLLVPVVAQAASSVIWDIHPVAAPSNFQLLTGSCEGTAVTCEDHYTLVLVNVGSQESSGQATITDTLPPGLTTSSKPEVRGGGWECTPGVGNSVVTCTSSAGVAPFASGAVINIFVAVAPGTQGTVTNHVQVAGGGAEEAVASVQTPITSQVVPFGPFDLSAAALDGGALDTRAGGHPTALSASVDFSTKFKFNGQNEPSIQPVESARQIVFDLPAGLVGDPQAAPTCSLTDMSNLPPTCPRASQVGTLQLIGGGLDGDFGASTNLRIYNVHPEVGHPAEFGVYDPLLNRYVVMYASVRGAPDYGVRVTTQPLPTALETDGVVATFFGNPAVQDESPLSPAAFFSNPTDCTATGFTTTVHVDSWENPGRSLPDGAPDLSDPAWKSASSTAPAVSGCEALHFDPSFVLQPDTSSPDDPAGVNVDLHIPQSEDPQGLATPPLRNATVTLPQGLVVSPSSADGLQGCSTSRLALESTDPAACPQASQIGTVEVITPLIDHPLPGEVYLGDPDCSPCTSIDAQAGRLIKLYIQVDDPVSGVVVKIPGTVSTDPSTGQVRATFKDSPQLPFSDLKLSFKSGPRAPVATPSECGAYTTESDLSPWSAPATPDATPSSLFQISGCGDPNRFAPSFESGTTNAQAAAFSPFTLGLSRADADQQLSGLSATLPAGLLARLAGVPVCGGVSANLGACPESSRIGSVSVGVGPGSHPFFVSGKIFLTGSYKGGPFGEVVVVPAVAGPFNLGTVAVRGGIYVDPHTAQASIVSDPFPTILDGIQLQIKTVNVTVDRPGFMFNPTSCSSLSVNAMVTSVQRVQVPVSSHFQAANCASLSFKPGFTASTGGRASKAGGASLDVKVSSGAGQANIGKIKVDLPKQLPSRLSTLQKACLASVFDANPANCSSASDVGMATASTPVLASPLVGPAYLVSHGGQAFPDLEVVLQGEGVKVFLVGNTQIKKGITSSTFKAIPDAPVSSFELKLPTGQYSILGANVPQSARYSLCGQSLSMPTAITGQNGAVIKKTTKIAVTGCARHKAKAKHRAKKKAKKQVRHGSPTHR